MIYSNEGIHEKLDAILSLLTAQNTKPLTLSEAAAYLGMSKSYLYRLTSQGVIPFYKPAGKKIYFAKADLDHYLFRNRRRSKGEMEEEAATYVMKHH